MTCLINPGLIDEFSTIVGKRYTLTTSEDVHPYTRDARGRYNNPAQLVLKPSTVKQVSNILKLATKTRIGIIPQGGNTGLSGGALPLNGGDKNEIIVSMERMNLILEPDLETNTMGVEAGSILRDVQKKADEVNRLFPLFLGSDRSCQIGGNISSNAGGMGVLAYGNTRELIMGLEVVLPNGDIWNGLSCLRKDNTGFDLKNLFIGAEGTLGIITKAILKLCSKPRGQKVALVCLETPSQALQLLNQSQFIAGGELTGFELMSSLAMEFTLKYKADNIQRPFIRTAPWYVLIEISSRISNQDAYDKLKTILTFAYKNDLIIEDNVSLSSDQNESFWRLRRTLSESQKSQGASVKHDISLPLNTIPSFINQADRAIMNLIPGARICNFGHLGDGNLHYNITQPVDWNSADFYKHEAEIQTCIYEIVEKFQGSISAEHGIGQMKTDKLEQIKDPIALSMMKKIKQSFDPGYIMNPGKLLK
ncbi:FAD-binding oxidoreductase [Candidatus Endowatersipora endosymbiont of Watersipora subatra]|uniref:FAD-binding oxidoreductase n=1 Tax=Candidatus Endowatersipora endosymbiont of Watersipora subatra TaxID=3077946 RepID=UPI00312CBC86